MTLLIELAVKSTVVAGAALAVLALLGRRSAAERSWVAHAALVVLAALPAAVTLLPRWRLMPPVERAPDLCELERKELLREFVKVAERGLMRFGAGVLFPPGFEPLEALTEFVAQRREFGRVGARLRGRTDGEDQDCRTGENRPHCVTLKSSG